MEDLTPAQIVAELDRYVIGQESAKRAVAVALRNRFRRQLLSEELRQEIQPKNILMIGPTGVGKTEIARRVARIVEAPFVKVEATKFTEVGYVGRDVESIIRDLVEISIDMLHGQRLEAVRDEASSLAIQRLADLLAEKAVADTASRSRRAALEDELDPARARRAERQRERKAERERQRILQMLVENQLEDETVEIELEAPSDFDEPGPLDFEPGMTPDDFNTTSFEDFFDRLLPRRSMRRRVSVREARRILTQQESDRLVDIESVIDEAIARVEEAGVVFIDEIDKTISADPEVGGDVSSEGVQRDLL
ncbi:MAG: AAA family ATPase, partial [Thermomicrobiales bacterium]|nr:AAA family ATPase [Thermomicrobiales bacterium]